MTELETLQSLQKTDGSFSLNGKLSELLKVNLTSLETQSQTFFPFVRTTASLNDLLDEKERNNSLFASMLVWCLLEEKKAFDSPVTAKLLDFLSKNSRQLETFNVQPPSNTKLNSTTPFRPHFPKLKIWMSTAQSHAAKPRLKEPSTRDPKPTSGRPTLRSKFMILARENDPSHRVVERVLTDGPLPFEFPVNCHPLSPDPNLPNHMTQISFGWCADSSCPVQHNVTVEKKIAAGVYSEIFLAKFESKKCAIKIFREHLGDVEQSSVLSEVDITTKLHIPTAHPNVVQVYAANIR